MLDRRKWKEKTERWVYAKQPVYDEVFIADIGDRCGQWNVIYPGDRKPLHYGECKMYVAHSRKRAIDKAYRKAGGR